MTLNVTGSITLIVFPIEFGTYTRVGIDRRRARIPPVAAAYTFTPPAGDDETGGVEGRREEAAGLVLDDDDAAAGRPFPVEHADAIRPSETRIRAARNRAEVRRGFTGEKHTGGRGRPGQPWRRPRVNLG
jgi:hypothetical protein